MSTWTIDALEVGQVKAPVAELSFRDETGRILDVPLIMFVLRNGYETIVVDTGGPVDEEHMRNHHPFPYSCPPHMHPLAKLEEIGVDPNTVSAVINTHLHWDHSSNNHLFPNARILIHRAELNYALAPIRPHRIVYELHKDISPPWTSCLDRLDLVDGEMEVSAGVTLVPLPGHTPGSQGVTVRTTEGTFLIAGDCIDLFENWSDGHVVDPKPSSSYTDLIAFYRSLEMIKREGWLPLPSHDKAVIDKGRYGALS